MAKKILHQSGVVAYRIVDGKIRVLLVTSRETGRWVIPRGNIAAGLTPAQSATKEAFEEAGIEGSIVTKTPLGFYTYFKRLGTGLNRAATVEVYPFRVERELAAWPEIGQRRLQWTTARKAASLVDEPGLGALILRLFEIERAAKTDDAQPDATAPSALTNPVLVPN